MSPNAERREPITASLHRKNVMNLPEMMKSIIGDEAMSVCSRRTFRGDRGERAPKEWSRYLGYPWWYGIVAKAKVGNNNDGGCHIRESERLIGARKSGKPDGAKEPCLRHAESDERRAA